MSFAQISLLTALVSLTTALVTSLPGAIRALAMLAIAMRAKSDDLPAIAKALATRPRQIGRKHKSG